MNSCQAATSTILISIGVLAITTPALHYIIHGWHAKRTDIMDGLGTEARVLYFKHFVRGSPPPSEQSVDREFESLYEKWYGRSNFVIPLMILAVAAAMAVSAAIFTALAKTGYLENPFVNLPYEAVAALAGAYMWVVNDFISRGRRLDFSPSDIRWGTLRLIVAIPMGYAFSSILRGEELGGFICFALGAFPLEALIRLTRRLANSKLGFTDDDESASDDIIKLQGINRTIVDRLLNEGVTTIVQIAYGDPVRLVMRSNLTFNFVTDTMNQALAWIYLKSEVDVIRPLGLRGALEIKNLIDAYDNADAEYCGFEQDNARTAFPLIAAALKQDPATLQIVFREIAGDPYTCFLHAVWSSNSFQDQDAGSEGTTVDTNGGDAMSWSKDNFAQWGTYRALSYLNELDPHLVSFAEAEKYGMPGLSFFVSGDTDEALRGTASLLSLQIYKFIVVNYAPGWQDRSKTGSTRDAVDRIIAVLVDKEKTIADLAATIDDIFQFSNEE